LRIPFRVIAIAGDELRVREILACTVEFPEHRFGVMLRDPEHRARRIEELAGYAMGLNWPQNITLITSSLVIPGIDFVHNTSGQLSDPAIEYPTGINVGYSVHSIREATLAEGRGAAYVSFSPVYPTDSKPGATGRGTAVLQDICERVSMPVFALGGIDDRNLVDCLAAGAAGFAGISLFHPARRASLRRALSILEGIKPL
jgi:hypothetical protein